MHNTRAKRPDNFTLVTEADVKDHLLTAQDGGIVNAVRKVRAFVRRVVYGDDGVPRAELAMDEPYDSEGSIGRESYGGLQQELSEIDGRILTSNVVRPQLYELYNQYSDAMPGWVHNLIHLKNPNNPEWPQRLLNGIAHVVLHQTGGSPKSEAIDFAYMAITPGGLPDLQRNPDVPECSRDNKGCPGAPYHFIIDTNGDVFQMNKLSDRVPGGGRNTSGVHVAFVGLFTPGHFHGIEPKESTTPSQEDAFNWFIPKLMADLGLGPKRLKGHCQLGDKPACPGDDILSHIGSFIESSNRILVKKLGGPANDKIPDALLGQSEFVSNGILVPIAASKGDAMRIGEREAGLSPGTKGTLEIDPKRKFEPAIFKPDPFWDFQEKITDPETRGQFGI